MANIDNRTSGYFSSLLWLWAIIIFLVGVALSLSHDLIPLPGSLQNILREIGFACIVASVVWLVFERLSERSAEQAWARRSEKIAEDVFYGVLRRKLPKELISTANELILAQDLIRRDLRLDYDISDAAAEIQKKCGCPIVKLDTRASYKLINIGDKAISHKLTVSLPNAILPDDNVFPMIVSTTIRRAGEFITPSETLLANAMKSKRQENDRVTFEIANLTFSPDDEISVAVEYSLLKYENDCEIFQSAFAADSLKISVHDLIPGQRRIGARALHRDKLTVDQSSVSSGKYQYSLEKFLLPHQGAVIWWTKPFKTTSELS